jgi:glycosyltransferase involved in cell wall biosynthesis
VLPATERVETIYYPVIPPLPNLKSENHSDTVIIQVSRMESWKGQETTLEALGRLRDTPGWTCLQVGGAQRPSEQRYLESLHAMCERLGISERVQFLGHRSDVASLLANADIFCQPNLEPEPFGIAFIEALYAGLPVVSSAIGGALEIVDAECGALVPPDDPAALAEVLARFIIDRGERERLGRMGPVRARERCEPGKQMRRIASVLERAAASRPVVH